MSDGRVRPRAVETYETLARRAATYGLIDLEVKALVDMAYPLSWQDAEESLAVVDQALRLSTSNTMATKQARTRASCLVRRIWACGWNVRMQRTAAESGGPVHCLFAQILPSSVDKR